MSQATASTHEAHGAHGTAENFEPSLPISIGKFAMWLFLATEIMFFTGLIGSYIVLRFGSKHWPTPAAVLVGIKTQTPGQPVERVKGEIKSAEDAEMIIVEQGEGKPDRRIPRDQIAKAIKIKIREKNPTTFTTTGGKSFSGDLLSSVRADPIVLAVADKQEPERISRKEIDPKSWKTERAAPHTILGILKSDEKSNPLIIEVEEGEGPQKRFVDKKIPSSDIDSMHTSYVEHESPLNLPLTAANTFFLICSSVTMVLALAAIQKGDQQKLKFYLFLTIAIGALFVGIQVKEYRTLLYDDHFAPNRDIFASCFYVMTGCHGAHVSGGVLALILVLLNAMRGKYTQKDHDGVELVGLYWHFVDLVWILLFTVVYLI